MKNIIHGLNFNEYLARPGISSSALKRAGKTPAHYFAPAKEQTEAMRIGTALHAHFLEGRVNYTHRPPGTDRRTKEGKAAYEAWANEALAGGAVELTAEQCANIAGAVHALKGNQEIMAAFKTGAPEVSIFTQTGKCRCDWYAPDVDGGMIIDLKKTADASRDGFMRQAANLEYWLQAAWYLRLTGASRFLFLAVETEPPYAHGVYEYTDVAFANANAVIDMRIDAIAAYEEMRDKQAIISAFYGVHNLELPVWAIK